MAPRVQILEDIANGTGPFSRLKLRRLRRWLEENWEAADMDRDAVKVIRRLLDTISSRKGK